MALINNIPASKQTPPPQPAPVESPVPLEALSQTSRTVNEASKRLSTSVDKLNEALKKLNLGIPVWLPYCTGGTENGSIVETEELGYAKVKGTWGISLRQTIEGLSADDDVTEWPFNSAPRDMRLRSAPFFRKMLEALNEESIKQAKIIQERANDIDELTGIVTEIAKKARPAVSLRPSAMEAE